MISYTVDNFGTVVGENPYGNLALWAVNGLSIICYLTYEVGGSFLKPCRILSNPIKLNQFQNLLGYNGLKLSTVALPIEEEWQGLCICLVRALSFSALDTD